METVTALRNGSQDAAGARAEEARTRFAALVGEHLDGLYGTAVRLTRNRTTAEDLVQEAMLRGWRSFHTFQPGTNFRAWMYRILMNAHFDRHRKDTRTPEVVQDEVSDSYLYTKARESAALSDAASAAHDTARLVPRLTQEADALSASLPAANAAALQFCDERGNGGAVTPPPDASSARAVWSSRTALHHLLVVQEGVYAAALGMLHLSTVMTAADIDKVIVGYSRALANLAESGIV